MHWAAIFLCVGLVSCAAQPQRPGPRAAAESSTPIHRGGWNQHAKQFIWAPTFAFPEVKGAKSYRFTASSADGTAKAFESPHPTAPLTPIWQDLPIGRVVVQVCALDCAGRPLAMAQTRSFHRAASFNGPYGKPVVPYARSADLALASLMREPFVRSWRTSGKPDPSYPLYRYAAKVIGSLVGGCALYSQQSPKPADADEALGIGRAAADFLISISAPANAPLAFFPPTYHGAKPTERENDHWTMLMTPAEAAQGYLDLHDATGEAKYFDAARKIADTYAKIQLPSGTWHLKVDNRTAEPLVEVELIPSEVIRFLDRLITQYDARQYQPALDRAVAWMMQNPLRTFDFKAQFDDAKVRGPYENLSKHEACQFAVYLFARCRDDPAKRTAAAELLRFAEDQFVVWEKPPQLSPRAKQLAPEHWITPCSCEQYAMFEPISGSSAWMIVAYLQAYQATQDPLHLAKARSLGNALTVAQQRHGGRYPTRMIDQDPVYWLNSTVNTARAMRRLANERIAHRPAL